MTALLIPYREVWRIASDCSSLREFAPELLVFNSQKRAIQSNCKEEQKFSRVYFLPIMNATKISGLLNPDCFRSSDCTIATTGKQHQGDNCNKRRFPWTTGHALQSWSTDSGYDHDDQYLEG
jgi:hypothetical protein